MDGGSPYEEAYRKRYADTPLENILLFRSGPMARDYVRGMDFSDNARTLFEYALRIGLNRKYKLIWLVKEPDKYAEKYSKYEGVSFLPYAGAVSKEKEKREAYFRALCLAKFIFFTDSYGFALHARADQIRVQLWHGCGFKTRLGFSRCENRYEYMTVTGQEYVETYAKTFGLRKDQMLLTGYPKADDLFHPLPDWQARFHIPEAEHYIFWLPTFRTESSVNQAFHETLPEKTGLPVVSGRGQLEALSKQLKEEDTVLVIKLHPFHKREWVSDIRYSNVILLENEQLEQEDVRINELLGHADALISDYSSTAVDYLVTDRPIAFTLDDVEEYEKDRGFFWPDIRNWLPGYEIFDFEGFCRFLREAAGGKDPGKQKREGLKEKMQKYSDDGNSRRVLQALGIIG